MRLLRRRLLLDYIRCPELTKSGLRHEHILFRGSYIEQAFLGELWSGLHGAPIIDIRRVTGKRRLAGYFASYLAKEVTGRLAWSWGWVWRGFVHGWTCLKKFSREMGWTYQELLTNWKWCLILDINPIEVLPNEIQVPRKVFPVWPGLPSEPQVNLTWKTAQAFMAFPRGLDEEAY